ncbi:hypothetical protein [Lactococcus lactis]|uniref:hypothetical protein n=1 Tax=Lactococcus lactis TaxID=1358 RepID=UPI003A800E60
MTDKKWIDLGMKYGGFRAKDACDRIVLHLNFLFILFGRTSSIRDSDVFCLTQGG